MRGLYLARLGVRHWVMILLILGVGHVVSSDPRTKSGARVDRQQKRPVPHVIREMTDYRETLGFNHSEKEMVRMDIPGMKVDLVYATDRNRFGRRLYPAGTPAVLRKGVVKALARVQRELADEGLGLKLFDGYRPYSVTEELWNSKVASPIYLAPPWLGSDHNRGIAVDITLVRLPEGRELDMGTEFDDFSRKAFHSWPDATSEQKANRRKLREAMEEEGFVAFDREWWHYHYRQGKDWELLDLPAYLFQ